MHAYTAYGLGIHSALLLPELVAGARTQDVLIRLGKIAFGPNETAEPDAGVWVTSAGTYVDAAGVGRCLVREGREIVVDAAPNVEPDLLRLFLLGPVLTILLHQRGLLVLHASAVAMNGGAVAFLGARGWGKSTLAATLHDRGHPVLADDVTAVDQDAPEPRVRSGFPQLKLRPEALDSLGGDWQALPRLYSRSEKRARRVSRGFPQGPLPLKCIYVLAGGSEPALEPIAPREALVELVRHWYCARFGNRLLRNGAASAHLLRCGRLVTAVPIRLLRKPSSLPLLHRVVRLVEDDQHQSA